MAARKRVKIDAETVVEELESTANLVEREGVSLFTHWLERNGQKLEPGQLALAKVMFDKIDPIDLEGEERERALRIFGCDRVPPEARKLGQYVAVCGGRGGKSLLAAWRLVYLAATLPLVLSPGEQAYAIIVAPDQRLSEQVLRYCVGIAQTWFPEEGRVCEESSLGFTLVRAQSGIKADKYQDDRVRFLILPASKGGSAQRGRALVGAVLDEAAFFRGEDSVINDKELFDAITPRIMLGGELIVTTTPYARSGEVFRTYDRNFGHPVDAVVAHAPTWELRTDEKILAQVERERERDPWNFAREFGAQFIDRDEGTFFDGPSIDACTEIAA